MHLQSSISLDDPDLKSTKLHFLLRVVVGSFVISPSPEVKVVSHEILKV